MIHDMLRLNSLATMDHILICGSYPPMSRCLRIKHVYAAREYIRNNPPPDPFKQRLDEIAVTNDRRTKKLMRQRMERTGENYTRALDRIREALNATENQHDESNKHTNLPERSE
jgi:hypothetical protein